MIAQEPQRPSRRRYWRNLDVVTDERRFQQPFSMETALNKSEHWWNAAEANQVLPTDVAIALSILGCRVIDWAESRARHIHRRNVSRS